MQTTTGSWVALAGLIVAALGHFGFIIDQNAVITVIAGIVALYGIIHQYIVTNKVVAMAKAAGVQGIK